MKQSAEKKDNNKPSQQLSVDKVCIYGKLPTPRLMNYDENQTLHFSDVLCLGEKSAVEAKTWAGVLFIVEPHTFIHCFRPGKREVCK